MASPVWGPFDGPADAHENLCKFVNTVLDPSIGIAWLSPGGLFAIRRPTYDANGDGEIITFEFRPMPAIAAPAPHPRTFLGRLRAWFDKAMELQGEAAMREAQANLEMGRIVDTAVATMYQRAVGEYGEDTLGVTLDAIGVAMSLLLIPFGLGILGEVALIAGGILLATDGLAYVTEMSGFDDSAKFIKEKTFYARCLAVLGTLPDAAWGLGEVLLKGSELTAKLARAEQAASNAARGSQQALARAANASGAAARSAQLAKANRFLRASQSAEQRAESIRAKLLIYLGANYAGRAVIPPGVFFLAKEDVDNSDNQDEITNLLRRYVFHVAAVRRE